MPKLNQTFAISAAVSAAGCIAVLIAAIVGYLVDARIRSLDDDRRHGAAIAPRFHIRFSGGGVWFYSEELPYRGEVNFIGGGRSRVVRDSLWHLGRYGVRLQAYARDGQTWREDTSCDLPGIYYRRFDVTGAPPDWTLRVSCLYPFTLLAIVPALWTRRRLRSRHNHAVQPTVARCAVSGG